MFILIEKAVIAVAMLRLLSGSVEIMAAILMLKLNDIEKVMIVNSSLALVGPLIFITTTAIGLWGMAGNISLSKLLWIILGIAFILYGIKAE
ncbi:DUF2619 domain-containing protein [Bacillus aerolatus]|uniref:DUF2619 domain-containing protein n=1 Tax=Bacillus aerolatus TaxID=2653354 RepID=A0A6I1FG77_9BACI|nr:YqhV family protein [Bacillus aerolatus]KAB7704389.1 DUF2619 domain-containing protein [Bacillus aerolatus]